MGPRLGAGLARTQTSQSVTVRSKSGPRCYRTRHRGPSPTSISICNILGRKISPYCYRSRRTVAVAVGRRGQHPCRVSPRLPLAGVAGLFTALPPRWGCADRRIVLLTACQLVWEAPCRTFDIAIVGAGITGCAIARQLARYDLSICVVEAANDIALGASKANGGLVHAGYDPAPGTVKAQVTPVVASYMARGPRS